MAHKNKEDKLKYQRSWELRNREKRYAWNKRDREKATDFVNKLKEVGCSMCEEKDICCLDFHHLDPSEKETNIARAINCGWTPERLQKEIDKCILVCSNCHRKIENKIRQSKKTG